jgi:hypothetical protein
MMANGTAAEPAECLPRATKIFAHEILYTVVDQIPTPVAHPGIRVSKRRLRHTHELKPTSKVHIRVAHSEAE